MTTCPDCQHPDCDDCGTPMVTEYRWQREARPAGHVMAGGRGLCSACYQQFVARQKILSGPGWLAPAQPRPDRGHLRSIGTWAGKHADVKRAHSP